MSEDLKEVFDKLETEVMNLSENDIKKIKEILETSTEPTESFKKSVKWYLEKVKED
jgi:hypothetical protein